MSKIGRIERQKLRNRLLGFALIALAALPAGVTLAQSAVAQNADAIEARKQNFKTLGAQMKAIKKALESGEGLQATKEPVAKLLTASQAIGTHFPADSQQGDTKAKPNIWTDSKGFKQDVDAELTAAQALSKAQDSGDLGQFKTAFADLGKTCGDCHHDYRTK